MTDSLLAITNLYVQYETIAGDVKALNGVSVDLSEEQIFCLVGESGSGKSTLALAMLGLLPDNATVIAGDINFDGIINIQDIVIIAYMILDDEYKSIISILGIRIGAKFFFIP